jgi:hypothetical protein
MRAQAEANVEQANDILKLYDRLLADIPRITHSQFAAPALDALFMAPVFRQANFVKHATIPRASGARIVRILLEQGILEVVRPGAGRRSAILRFPQLLDIVNREQFMLKT